MLRARQLEKIPRGPGLVAELEFLLYILLSSLAPSSLSKQGQRARQSSAHKLRARARATLEIKVAEVKSARKLSLSSSRGEIECLAMLIVTEATIVDAVKGNHFVPQQYRWGLEMTLRKVLVPTKSSESKTLTPRFLSDRLLELEAGIRLEVGVGTGRMSSRSLCLSHSLSPLPPNRQAFDRTYATRSRADEAVRLGYSVPRLWGGGGAKSSSGSSSSSSSSSSSGSSSGIGNPGAFQVRRQLRKVIDDHWGKEKEHDDGGGGGGDDDDDDDDKDEIRLDCDDNPASLLAGIGGGRPLNALEFPPEL